MGPVYAHRRQQRLVGPLGEDANQRTCVPCADEEEIDFMGFLRMVSSGSGDSLDQYDPRTASSHALAALDGSGHGGLRHGGSAHGGPPGGRLPAVAEEARK